MPKLLLYSNLAGSFLFNHRFHLIDSIMFRKEDIPRVSDALREGRYIEEEKRLASKHRKGEFIFVGFKTENLEGVRAEFDDESFAKISESLAKDKGVVERLRTSDESATIRAVKGAVGPDTHMIQAISSVRECERISNTLARRMREWHDYCLPELSESISEHERYAEELLKKDRAKLLSEMKIRNDDSMGAEFTKDQTAQVKGIAKAFNEIILLRDKHVAFLEGLMKKHCPNVQAVAGTLIGARLIEQAGSLKRMTEMPSSTIQILGAEEAFFRHMRTGAKMPKFGYLHAHPFVAEAERKDKGKIARALADKICIAAKIDHFKGDFAGDKLRKQVESRLKTAKQKGKSSERPSGKKRGHNSKASGRKDRCADTSGSKHRSKQSKGKRKGKEGR
ncbi:MAG: NOP5/NOP56 family protein [Candidatus Woesearchaeota archaeon]